MALTSDTDLVAMLQNKAECQAFAAFLNSDKSLAGFMDSSLDRSLLNFGNQAQRTADIATLSTRVAAAATDLAAMPEGEDKLRKKAEMLRDDQELTRLQTKNYTQGGDDRAQKCYERNSYAERIARADRLLPLVAAREAALPS